MSPRRDIRMDAGEVTTFLAGRTRAVVVALDGDGRAHGAVGRLEVEQRSWEQGSAAVALRSDDRVVALLRADPRACCVVEQFPSYYQIRGVMIHGHARPAARADGEARFTIDVERVVSYDFGKLLDG